MSPDEYRAAIAALGLNQREAADFLDAHEVTSRRWASNKPNHLAVPRPYAMLLRVMIAKGLTVEDVRKIARDP